MGSLTTCCLVFLIAVLSLAIFTSMLVIPVALWHPQTFQSRVNALLTHLEYSAQDEDVHWGYGILQKLKELIPKDWGKKYSDCDMSLQSPINIIPANAINNTLLEPMEYLNYEARPWGDIWTVTNNGHTVQFSASFTDPPQLTRGGLVPGRYDFRQFHFHWGSNDTQGSEHTVDGRQYPLEVHLIHIKSTVDPSPYKIAALGVLFELSDSDSNEAAEQEPEVLAQMAALGRAAKTVLPAGTSREISLPGFSLSQFVPADERFFRYYGSLTTPPCSQFLQWTVMAKPLPVTRQVLEMFRQLLKGGHGHASERLLDNFRPYQPMTGRVINYFGGW
ncbi:putative Carbonic anhydrase 7 [Hypsibius exemplaris]|uniref:Carbonic anhydrase n=1 Tax=Hypsibius exemplaris TaxID=2072580 RepID=A0A9X6NG04_HYPEX|nr:putative Carbonic anhydrase 7 [Hypsibius exemplaris]